MLTADDTPTIRHSILKRLGLEPNVRICDIKFQKAAGEISVGVLANVGNHIITRSAFVLPDPFELGHLHNEIDEIAVQYRLAARDHFTAALPVSEERFLRGTGLRGNWARYGLRHV
jgi:hypothetical protein